MRRRGGNSGSSSSDETHSLLSSDDESRFPAPGKGGCRGGVRVTVVCGGETAHVTLPSATLFPVFDAWVRSRFALSPEVYGVSYLDQSLQEVIPDFSSPAQQTLTVSLRPMRVARPLPSAAASDSKIETAEAPEKEKTKAASLSLLSFSAVFPLTALIYLVIFLSPHSPIPNPMRLFSFFSPVMTLLGIETEAQVPLYREMICTFLAWPVPYFFIRRSLNPDFGFALSVKKFGSDSFWGALAACVVVLLRHLVKTHLSLLAEEP